MNIFAAQALLHRPNCYQTSLLARGWVLGHEAVEKRLGIHSLLDVHFHHAFVGRDLMEDLGDEIVYKAASVSAFVSAVGLSCKCAPANSLRSAALPINQKCIARTLCHLWWTYRHQNAKLRSQI